MLGNSLATSQGQIFVRNFGKRAQSYLLIGIVIGLGVGFLVFKVQFNSFFNNAQRFYFKGYVKASLKQWLPMAGKDEEYKVVAFVGEDGVGLGIVPHDEFPRMAYDETRKAWYVRESPSGRRMGVVSIQEKPDRMSTWYRVNFFEGRTIGEIWWLSGVLGVLSFVITSGAGIGWDVVAGMERRRGVVSDGLRPVSGDKFRELVKAEAFVFEGITAWGDDALCKRTLLEKWSKGRRRQSFKIGAPLLSQFQHLGIAGSTGSGKSQHIFQLLEGFEDRGIKVVVYDPDGDFFKYFYKPERGDVVLNADDERFLGYSLISEIETDADASALIESIFPGRGSMTETGVWFVERARELVRLLLSFKPSNAELLHWISDGSRIDELLRSVETPLREVLSPKAEGQRQGVLGTVAALEKVLRLISTCKQGEGWSAKEWAKERKHNKGWVFITTRPSDRESQIPLVSLWLDCILRRAMMVEKEEGQSNPIAFVVDELDSLRKLPKLPTALQEGRKKGLCLVIGYQSFVQLEANYGKPFSAMLAQITTRVYYKNKYGENAKRIAEDIGKSLVEREEISTTESVQDNQRDSTSLRVSRHWEELVTATHIQHLPDLTGYFCHGMYCVRFRTVYREYPTVHVPFIPRKDLTESFWKQRDFDAQAVPMASPEIGMTGEVRGMSEIPERKAEEAISTITETVADEQAAFLRNCDF